MTVKQQEITSREGEILNLLVRSYIHTATPVASVHITKKIKRALSPASVRNDLKNLQRHIAMKLHLVSGILGRGAVLGTMGFEQLFTEPEFSEQNMVIQFGRFLDNISKKQSYYTKKLSRKRVTIVIEIGR